MRRIRVIAFVCLLALGLTSTVRAQNFVTGDLTAAAASTAVCTTASCVSTGLGQASGSVAIVLSGTHSGTVQFEVTAGGAANSVAKACDPVAGGAAVSSATANGTWTCNVAALQRMYVRVSTYTSGTFTVRINASNAPARNNTFTATPTFATMTEGSVLFAGPSGLLSQDNTNLFWNNTTNNLQPTILNGIRFADRFPGATVALQMTAACDDLAGGEGLTWVPDDMGAGAAPTLPAGCSQIDVRGGGSGGVLLLRNLITGSPYGFNSTIQTSPDGINGTAILGDARSAGSGANIIGVTGYNASTGSSAVFGYNEGSGGIGGVGVQGDSPNLPGAISVLGTTAVSGSTLANPSIGIDGLAALHATEGATIAGRFRNDNGLAILAQQNSAAGAAIDPQVLQVQSGLNRATHLSINNTSTGGKRWDLVSTGASDPFVAEAGWFYIWNQPDNRPVIAAAPASPTLAFYTDATGINFRAATSFPGKLTHSITAARTYTLPDFSGNVVNSLQFADLTAQSAAIGATTLYAVPAAGAGLYRICYEAKLTTVDGVSSTLGGATGFQVIYTHAVDSVVTTTAAGPNSPLNTTQAQLSGCINVNAAASTNIQFSFGYTSNTPGQMIFALGRRLEKL